MEEFDPYLEWLGIGPQERPVNHYRLLGLSTFESDATRITTAADERMSLVRSYQTGPRGALTQRLLNELASARVCLLNPHTKATYDDFLRGLAAASMPPASPASSVPGGAAPAAILPGPVAMPVGGPWAPVAMPAAYPGVAPPTVAGGFATPVAQPSPMGAIPMATPVAYYPAGLGATPGAAPTAYAPAPTMSVAPPASGPVAAPPLPPAAPPAPATPPPVARGRRAGGDEAAAGGHEAAGATSDPLVTRRWFPFAVVGAVGAIAAAVWGVGRALRRREGDDGSVAATDGGESVLGGDAGAGEDKAAGGSEDDGKSRKSKDDYPGEVILSQEGNGDVNFPPTVARLEGPELKLDVEGPEPVISGWKGDDDSASWDFRIVKPDIFRVEITYAADAAWAGGRFVASVGDASKSGDVVDSGGVGSFRTDKVFLPVKRKGKHVLTVRTERRKGEQLWVLKSIRFIPQGVAGK